MVPLVMGSSPISAATEFFYTCNLIGKMVVSKTTVIGSNPIGCVDFVAMIAER